MPTLSADVETSELGGQHRVGQGPSSSISGCRRERVTGYAVGGGVKKAAGCVCHMGVFLDLHQPWEMGVNPICR